MIELSYSTHGLTHVDMFTLIDKFEQAGYQGIEIAFQNNHFDPYEMTKTQLITLKNYFQGKQIKPACINPPPLCFPGTRLHDPSLFSLEKAARKQRIQLIKEGVNIAKLLGAPLVAIGSGVLREEHVNHSHIDPKALLIDSLHECLDDIGNVTLVIEPEPGLYIERLDEAIDLIKAVDSEQFKLHIDLCHTFCTEHDYIAAIEKALPYTRYFHVSDTQDGNNVKIICDKDIDYIDLDFAAYLIYFDFYGSYLFVNKENCFYFYDKKPSSKEDQHIKSVASAITSAPIHTISYESLPMHFTSYDAEIDTFLRSIPKLNVWVIERTRPILQYLRNHTHQSKSSPVLNKMIANTLTGKVHFHDIPGRGQINFAEIFKILKRQQYAGFMTVELYHHGDEWEHALYTSKAFLSQFL